MRDARNHGPTTVGWVAVSLICTSGLAAAPVAVEIRTADVVGFFALYDRTDGTPPRRSGASRRSRLLGRLSNLKGALCGPSGVTDGAVFKYDTDSGAWTDITAPRSSEPQEGGYMGLSVDAQQSGTLLVATLSRYNRDDTIWRSTDSGKSWQDLRLRSAIDRERAIVGFLPMEIRCL